jgi:lipoprotein-anchoring transpeptidase ErfK/SrfK
MAQRQRPFFCQNAGDTDPHYIEPACPMRRLLTLLGRAGGCGKGVIRGGFQHILQGLLTMRAFISRAAIAAVTITIACTATAQAQRDEERPGYVPSAAEEQLPPQLQRTVVYFRTTEAPGTIIVDTPSRYLYLVQGNSRALRYGIGVGREGFQWSGLVNITRKQEWPDWTPPPEMIARQPYLPRFMGGGPGNPMGARALYLGTTVYRLHGTNAPETIGTAVSSGCFRLVNPDIIDLYERVPIGTKVVIRQTPTL